MSDAPKRILPIIFSGFGTEISGPRYALHEIGRMIQDITPPEGFVIVDPVYKPYSVLPGDLVEFLMMAADNDYFVLVGHSFGGAAAKWLVDRFKEEGLLGRVIITCLLDGVPNTDRFGEFAPSQLGDLSEKNRWGIDVDVSPKAFQIFQRAQFFPQGTQIRTIAPAPPATVPSHWNKSVAEFGHADDGHGDVPADPVIQEYVQAQVMVAIQELAGVNA